MTALHAPPAAPEVLAHCTALVRPALREAIGRLHPWTAEMAAYSFGWCEVGGAPATTPGGKGVRQALAILGARAAGTDGRAGIPAAVAVELVHTFSLLHDDIMDGDAMRRRRPAVWKAYGTGPAVLAGDALFALAVETLAAVPQGARAVRLLSAALTDLVRGQADDLLFTTRPFTGRDRVTVEEYRATAEAKTGALLGCACALGALLGGADEDTAEALDRAGRHLGIAFQLVDDVLGIWGDPAVTGKPTGGDLREGKKTYPVLSALTSPAARALPDLLNSPARTQEAADLIEKAGGRTAALAEARTHTDTARTLLTRTPLATGAAEDLLTVLDYLVGRDL
ncbi:polyprenyl synthetase family protein [Streptomyces griseofuscus]|uniref:polyprenyl synthetase family protein n=1 Tax=Streptomyces TaxID=1883 RepID=UPI00118CEE46|nr:polyprenyl synthetase family protein [Streptomyces murinus]MBA9050754.1 geranylgeranyl diphosphate synthase type I [Streptomyces murinus]BBC91193.1 polyprenyl synthetase family protein [Streptomyces rochei]BBC98728.1 polyprenyl synthetase family protein [Streptomyces rochei]